MEGLIILKEKGFKHGNLSYAPFLGHAEMSFF
jgi:hypothetical protein